MRERVPSAPWRLTALAFCAVVGLLWASSQLLALQGCQEERDRASRAEEAAFRVHAEHEQALQRRVRELELQLAERPGNLQDETVKSLKDRVAALEGERATLMARSVAPVQAGAAEPVPERLAQPQVGQRLRGGVADARAGPVTEDLLRQAAGRGAIGVAVISCQRPKYLKKAMESILQAKRDAEHFPIVISQDDFDPAMTQMVESQFVSTGIAYHMHHPHEASAHQVAQRFGGDPMTLGYVRIAQHFGFAMRRMFDDFGFQQVIFLEEDMEIAPDFFSYFAAMLPLLRSDKDLFCVSAWNDNGYSNLVQDPKAAFRTDFFPGLGWMMTKSMWEEVRDRWAVAYWDEFMRRKDVRRGRHCIRPEISRSFTFGEEGTSGGQFFASHLQRIQLNSVAVDWAAEDLHFLSSAAAFDEYLSGRLRQARRVDLEAADGLSSGQAFRIEYDDAGDYKRVAHKFGLMPDEKEGIRRMSYRGVIPFAWKGARVYLYTRQWPGSLS